MPPRPPAQLETFLAAKTNVTQVVEPLKSWLAEQHAAIVITPIGKKFLFQTIAAALPDTGQLKRDAGLDDDEDADDDKDGKDDDGDDDDEGDDDKGDDDKGDDDKGDKGDDDKGDDDDGPKPLGGPAAIAVQPAGPFQAIGEMFGGFKTLFADADEQLTHLAAGIQIEDNATLRVTARALVVPGGDLAHWSQGVKVPAEGLLAGLPEGKFVIAYGGASAQFSPAMWAILNQFGDAGMQMMGLDEAGRKEYARLAEKLQKGKQFTGGVMGMMRPGIRCTARPFPSSTSPTPTNTCKQPARRSPCWSRR